MSNPLYRVQRCRDLAGVSGHRWALQSLNGKRPHCWWMAECDSSLAAVEERRALA
jgi:hypothetical protein